MCKYTNAIIILVILIIIFLLYNNSEYFRGNYRRNYKRDHRGRYRPYYTDLSGRNVWFNWNGRRQPYYYYPELYYNYFPFPYSYYNPCVETIEGEIMCYY